jgi:hypothetical protein
MAKIDEIKKSFEKKGWKFKVYMSGRGIQAEKGNLTITGTSWSNLFKNMRSKF